MKKLLLMIMMMSSITIYAQDVETIIEEVSYLSFRHKDTDKYYMGWMNPRTFISRAFMHYNPDLSNALLVHDPDSADAWGFQGGCAVLKGRVATELYLARFPNWGIGFGGALEIPLLFRKSHRAQLYDVMGQAALFADVFLPYDMKFRFLWFHESTHYADGYEGDQDKGHLSYEFFGFELYKKFYESSFYGGIEITYRSSEIDNRTLRTRIHLGTDYRYPVYNNINFITGFNFAMLYDEEIKNYPEAEGWHPALNIGAGLEFDRYIVSIKYARERGLEASTYHTMQNRIGAEITVLF